jgi:hypothetical protein
MFLLETMVFLKKPIIYYMSLTETFYVCLITTLAGLFLKLASLAYKSKCKQCSCFGISILRDVIIEEKYDEVELEKGTLNKTKSDQI